MHENYIFEFFSGSFVQIHPFMDTDILQIEIFERGHIVQNRAIYFFIRFGMIVDSAVISIINIKRYGTDIEIPMSINAEAVNKTNTAKVPIIFILKAVLRIALSFSDSATVLSIAREFPLCAIEVTTLLCVALL